jgi:APA family basic amino acid/polyamine antiporter
MRHFDIFRTKSVERAIAETDEPGHALKRDLSALDLMVFGVGVMIGTGIFVLTGNQAHDNAGPAIVVSFVLAGITCALAALCYAEFASTVPVAGSAYTFSYATLGEVLAWIIGWDLILELALGGAVVARGWSAYLQSLLDLPTWLAGDEASPDFAAMAIVAGLTVVAVMGTKISGRITGVLVVVKVAVVLFVIVAGLFFLKASNFVPFVPDSQPAPTAATGDATLLQTLFVSCFRT